MKMTLAAIATSLTLLAGCTRLEPKSIVLYNGALGNGNVPPEQQGWLVFGGKADSRNSKDGATHLVSNKSFPAGYSNYQFQEQSPANPSFPTLDRTLGYTIHFDVKIDDENHQGSDKNKDGIGDRAGFSIIAISNDKKGVELAFWKNDPNPQVNNRIWVQQDSRGSLFTHTAEGTSFNTSKKVTRYKLKVKGIIYQLFVENSPKPILVGRLRDYTAFDSSSNDPPLPYNPYATSNFLFLGDDTTSASASIELRYVAVETPS